MNLSMFFVGLFLVVFAAMTILWKKRIIFAKSRIRPSVIGYNPAGFGNKYRDKPTETTLSVILAIILLLGGLFIMVISLFG